MHQNFNTMDSDLTAANIVSGTVIFGITGNLVPAGSSSAACPGGYTFNNKCTGSQIWDSGWWGGADGDGMWWCSRVCGALPGAGCAQYSGNPGIKHCYCHAGTGMIASWNNEQSQTCVD
jgi:hypothetical protein